MRVSHIALGLSLLALPLTAQVSGSIKRDAPTVENTIKFADGESLTMSYTAIRFGEGQWMAYLERKDAYERFNQGAMARPIGSVTASCDLQVGQNAVPAGEYDMYFSLHEQAGWLLNLRKKGGEGDPILWRVVTVDSEQDCSRIRFDLTPGEAGDTAHINLMFGKMKMAKLVDVSRKSGQ